MLRSEMKLLRIKIYQPHAHFRIPFSLQRRHTYPIPPYSTVIGFLINLLGIFDTNEKIYQDGLKKIKISISGNFKSKTVEYIWLRNSSKKSRKERFEPYSNRTLNEEIENYGGQIPTKIDVLNDIRLLI